MACVRRQLEAFEGAVGRRDRWLYRRQRGLNEQPGQQHPEEYDLHRRRQQHRHQWEDAHGPCKKIGGDKRQGVAGSGETLLGLLDLLRVEAESLYLTRRLVATGAGWWTKASASEVTRSPERSTGSLRQRTGKLLGSLQDALVKGALVSQPLRSPAPGAGDREAVSWEAGACPSAATAATTATPRQRGWLLAVFCEVLAPYLRLMDPWISEGRIEDPHGELFFSQIGVGGAAPSGVGYAAGRKDHRFVGLGAGAEEKVPTDPLVHVWDTGIVVHEKALPRFLAPLASAVALAGQDISLMGRVRALVAAMPEPYLAAAIGRPALR